MTESVAPTIEIDGETVTPEGWMWVLGFAVAGCQWAIDQCNDPEFDLHGKMKDYYRRKAIHETQEEIRECERRLHLLTKKLYRLLEEHSERRV